MKENSALPALLRQLPLERLGKDEDAGVWFCSLPVPRGARTDWRLDGRATWARPLGQWPDAPPGSPRRLLLAADGGNAAPATVRLRAPPRVAAPDAAEALPAAPPTADLNLIERSPEEAFMWERHALRLHYAGHSFELALGLRRRDGVHWWEACRLTTLRELPGCREIGMGGAIPVELSTLADLKAEPSYRNRFLHRHNWLNGHVYARLYANGVCEIFAHHVNAAYVDQGADFDDVVPVLGFRLGGADVPDPAWLGPWDGRRTRVTIGAATLDLREAAPLATPAEPGSFTRAGEFVVWQPYLGMQLLAGNAAEQQLGSVYVTRAAEAKVLRGQARTVRFTLSLNPDRAPVVARYQAPAWWYGLCEEFQPAARLPVHITNYDRGLRQARRFVHDAMTQGGFDDGSLPRGAGAKRHRPFEPGWEGEAPYGALLLAWRTGDGRDHALALRSAYFFSDVAVDHASKTVRMHAYPPPATALPMMRALAPAAAWLETGDDYLRDVASAIVDTAWYRQKNSWPRLAIGRDACFWRGAVFLWRYLGDAHYRDMAAEGVRMIAASQRANGSFGDQGGGTGIHQSGGYITKPWMGCMALGPVLDYLELCPDDPTARACLRGFADWLLANRLRHRAEGVRTWSYQHDYNGRNRHYHLYSGEWRDLPTPERWHQNYLARLLPLAAHLFDDARYFDAFAESFGGGEVQCRGDHGLAQNAQYLPWLQAWLWDATWTRQGLRLAPRHAGRRTPRSAVIATPAGDVRATWRRGRVVLAGAPPGTVVAPRVLPTPVEVE